MGEMLLFRKWEEIQRFILATKLPDFVKAGMANYSIFSKYSTHGRGRKSAKNVELNRADWKFSSIG